MPGEVVICPKDQEECQGLAECPHDPKPEECPVVVPDPPPEG